MEGRSLTQYFLVQVNNSGGYPNITQNHQYVNDVWSKKNRDRDQGDVQPGDVLLVYCTQDVPDHGMSLAFQVDVLATSADHSTLSLGQPRWFTRPLGRNELKQLVDTGQLDDAFRSCGAQGFNIDKLESPAAQKALDLLNGTGGPIAGSAPQNQAVITTDNVLERLIETQLQQWIIEHWDQINFGADLELYEEDGAVVGEQYDTNSVGRIDLLCRDRQSGSIVVVELKRGRPSDAVVGQLARYIGWVRKNLVPHGAVTGIILAPDFDERLRYAALAIPGTRLLRYKTRFEVIPESV
jgi:hypothetical protein